MTNYIYNSRASWCVVLSLQQFSTTDSFHGLNGCLLLTADMTQQTHEGLWGKKWALTPKHPGEAEHFSRGPEMEAFYATTIFRDGDLHNR